MNLFNRLMLGVSLLTLMSFLGFRPEAQASYSYGVKITNGSGMPISPGVIYLTEGAKSLAEVGTLASAGLVKLCQTGNPADRLGEISQQSNVMFSQVTTGPILPGESLEISVPTVSETQSLQFEAMYGKTKDACSVFSVRGKDLHSSQSGAVVFSGKDEVILSGAFQDPKLPSSRHSSLCMNAMDAIGCVRELAVPSPQGKIRYFPGYLPSLVNYIEMRFGAEQVQPLILPTSGAVKFEITQH